MYKLVDHGTNVDFQIQAIPVGALVLKKNMRRLDRKGGKEEDRWLGPYVVTEVTKKGLYKLEKGGKEMKQTFNRSVLKKYVTPE